MNFLNTDIEVFYFGCGIICVMVLDVLLSLCNLINEKARVIYDRRKNKK